MERSSKKCVVGYETFLCDGKHKDAPRCYLYHTWRDKHAAQGRVHAFAFKKLITCCYAFETRFNSTLEATYRTVRGVDIPYLLPQSCSSVIPEQNGISLVLYNVHKDPSVVLSWTGGLSYEIKFCPFCGADIGVREMKVTKLTERFRMEKIFDGHDTEVLTEEE